MDTDKIPIRCNIVNSDPAVALGIKIRLNGQTLFETDHVSDTVCFEHHIDDHEQQHELCFELWGKKPEHTVLDDSGNMIKDAHLTLESFAIDDIDIPDWKSAEYTHDTNGTGQLAAHRFYGYMGCNGTVAIKFFTPIYLWLLENL